MSAQRELSDLLKHDLACNTFIREHGQAIAELIEACAEFCYNVNITSHAKIDAAVRKLTEPNA